MKEIYDFHDIKKNNKDIVSLLRNKLENEEFNKFIDLSKVLGIFNGGKYSNLIDEASNFIAENYDEDIKREWNQIYNTYRYLQKLNDKLFSSVEYSEANSINEEDELELILISTEIIARYFNDMKKDIELTKYNRNQKYIFDHALKSVYEKCTNEKGMILYENLTKCTTALLKHLFWKNESDSKQIVDLVREYDESDIEVAIKKYLYADKFRFISDLKNTFQYSNLVATENQEENSVYFSNDDIEFIKSYNIYNSRVKTIRSQHEAEFINKLSFFEKHVRPDTKNLETTSGRTISELMSCVELVYNLYVDDLNVIGEIETTKINLINIRQLLRAYTVLTQISEEYLKNTVYNSGSYSINSICIVKSREEIRKIFEDSGIDINKSDELIDVLTFNNNIKSSDIADCPLVPVGDKYIIIPSICIQTNGYLAIMSRVKQFKFQGNEFEKILIAKLNRSKINAIHKKINFKDEEYECDLMFTIKNDLYICECKAWGEASSLRGYYELYIKKKKACDQLNRIADFYSSNLQFIRNDLHKSKDWRPKKVHRVLITNTMIGDVDDLKGVRVLDFSYMDKFIKRNKPKLNNPIGTDIEFKGFADFDGKITLRRMNNFLYSDIPIRLQNARLIEIDEEFKLFDQTIRMKSYTDIFPNYLVSYNPEDLNFQKYISKLKELKLI